MNSGLKEKIEEQLKKVAGVEERYKWVQSLSDTANGQLTGKDKIMLETYVQASYFERIIRRANLLNTPGQIVHFDRSDCAR